MSSKDKGAATSSTKSTASSNQSDEQSTNSSNVSNKLEEQQSTIKIKDEPIDLTETESYKTFIEHEINDLLAERLSQLILDNKLSINEFDDNTFGSLKRIDNIEEGLTILDDFEQANDDKLKDGRINYLCDLIKKSEERVNGETSNLTTPNGESSSSSNQQSPAKSSTTATTTNQQQFQNNSNSQNQLEELKKKCDEISQRTGLFWFAHFK